MKKHLVMAGLLVVIVSTFSFSIKQGTEVGQNGFYNLSSSSLGVSTVDEDNDQSDTGEVLDVLEVSSSDDSLLPKPEPIKKETSFLNLFIDKIIGKDLTDQTTSPNSLPSFAPPNIAAAPCIPNTIPTTIATSINLCGRIPLTSATIITASNVAVTCAPGTLLIKAGGNLRFDGLQIAPGLTNVQITGCNIQGRFTNAIALGAGVTNSQINNNNIDQAAVGIKEEFNSQLNLYSGNTIKRTGIAMQLEGSQGRVRGSTITQNTYGIITGTNPVSLTSTTPNTICSLGTTINNFPAQPLPVYCSIPQSGKDYRIIGNSITNNNKGITTYSTDNTIKQNTIQSNQDGIEVNAMYVGSEINPYTWTSPQFPLFNVQEYFSTGHMIDSNILTQNSSVGIQLNGRSTYFWQSSAQYHRTITITGNTITNNQDGIVAGRKDTITNTDPYDMDIKDWGEYTDINNNQINNNLNDGIVLLKGNGMTDVRSNTINGNNRNGISVGSAHQSTYFQGLYPDWAYPRFIYRNIISNNIKDGIYEYNGDLPYVILNEINNNNRGIYIPEAPYGYGNQGADNIICNDLSYNTLEGFNFDAKLSAGIGTFVAYSGVNRLSHNRVLNNGADGLRYYIDPNYSAASESFPSRTYNNHIEGNGFTPNPAYSVSGYGINADGFYYHGFFANNFRNNNRGSARDSGSLQVEDMWEEYQYELGYDNVVCKNCGGSCAGDWDCGFYSGTCVNNICQPPPGSGLTCNPSTGTASCYANPNSLPYVYQYYYNYPSAYVPRGNFGLGTRPFVVPPSATPPLKPRTCSNNQQCETNSCESYPAPVNNQQCGNGDFINEPQQFRGYYQAPFDCPAGLWLYWPAYFATFPPQNPGGGDPTEPDSPGGGILYDSIPKEYRESQSIKEVLKDRAYIEKQIKKANPKE